MSVSKLDQWTPLAKFYQIITFFKHSNCGCHSIGFSREPPYLYGLLIKLTRSKVVRCFTSHSIQQIHVMESRVGNINIPPLTEYHTSIWQIYVRDSRVGRLNIPLLIKTYTATWPIHVRESRVGNINIPPVIETYTSIQQVHIRNFKVPAHIESHTIIWHLPVRE